MTVVLMCLLGGGCVYLLWQLVTLASLLATTGPEPGVQPLLRTKADFWSHAFARLLPESELRQQRQVRQLRACGYYRPSAWTSFQALRSALTAVPLITGLVCVNLAPADWQPLLLIATAVLPIVGWSLPGAFLARAAASREATITAALPDLLIMLHAAVQSGQSIDRALSNVAVPIAQLHPELAWQLQLLQHRSTVTDWSQAVLELADSFPDSPISDVGRLLLQSYQLGSRQGHLLQQCAADISDQLSHRAEQLTQRASVQLLFPVVLCLLPAVFLHLAGPSLLAVEEFRNENRMLPATADDSIETTGTRLRIPLSATP